MKTLLFLFLLSVSCFAQQAQTHDVPSGGLNPEPVFGANAKWVQGVGPGYWPYQRTGTCTGLNLCISPGTVPQCMGSRVEYAGTSAFALTDNATNWVYLDLDNSCAPAVNTTAYSNRNIAIAKITTVSGAITALKDDRTWDSSQVVLGGVNAQTGTTYTIAATDRGKLVTLSNGSAIAVSLPTTLGATFVVAIADLGVGTATLTPTSGTVNGTSSLTLGTNSGGWFFFDGTNWEAVVGGGSVTYNGQTVSLGGSGNVNIGSAAHSVALNQGNGNAITGLALGAHQVPVGVASADPVAKTITDCTDTGGNHLNYTQSTDAFSCGTTSAPLATVQTRRTCMIRVGQDNGDVLVDADLAQLELCQIDEASTLVEVVVTANSATGTPSVLLQKRHCSTFTSGACSAWTLSDLQSAALAVATDLIPKCAMSSTSLTCIDGTTSSSSITITNTSIAAGDWIELKSGTAGGTAKRVTVTAEFTVN